eukprot:NODE_643_length_5058_cov_0.251664.p4 type:complete len:206 gc:universal NODE_643_length_5058_cov_0.251664:717-100(-)
MFFALLISAIAVATQPPTDSYSTTQDYTGTLYTVKHGDFYCAVYEGDTGIYYWKGTETMPSGTKKRQLTLVQANENLKTDFQIKTLDFSIYYGTADEAKFCAVGVDGYAGCGILNLSSDTYTVNQMTGKDIMEIKISDSLPYMCLRNSNHQLWCMKLGESPVFDTNKEWTELLHQYVEGFSFANNVVTATDNANWNMPVSLAGLT